jgi:Mor family transcriptional regulator
MSYQDKYLKYKKKYLDLKNQMGGRIVNVYNKKDSSKMLEVDLDSGDDLYTLKQQVLSNPKITQLNQNLNDNDIEFYSFRNERCGAKKLLGIDDNTNDVCLKIEKYQNPGELIPRKITSGFIPSNNIIKEAKGKFKLFDGVFEGTVHLGKVYPDNVTIIMKGTGKITNNHNEVFIGEFLDGKLIGKGRIEIPNGVIFEGEFLDNLLHGEGKANEVAKILNYVDKDQSIRLNVDESDKIIKDNVFKGPLFGTGPYKTNERLKIELILADEDAKTIFINESGLYSLIFNSGKPEAKKFKHWVTSEVLPSIRKYGTYSIVNKMDYSVDKLDYYKDKDIIYVIYVKDNIYKFGTSYEITDRLNQHANNLKFNYIVKLYEVSNRTIALNCETKIKEMVKKLKIKSDFNNGLEFFETNLNYNINYVLELIDHIIAQTNLEHKYKACEIVSLNDINNLSELFKQMKQYVDTSLVNYQIVNKAQQLALIEEKLEINKEKELLYQAKIKELELEIKKMELQIEKIKKPSLIQQLINAKIIGNGKENNDSIDLNVTEELEEETSSGKKKTTTVAKIQNHPNKQCADCGCDIGFRSSRCGPCENKKRLKQSIETNKTRPTLSQLKSDLKTMSYVQVGKKYNVSDNCIRKWIRKYKSYNKLAN